MKLTIKVSGFLAYTLPCLALLSQLAAQSQEQKIDPYEKWLKEDVFYVITGEEKVVFEKLSTDIEKENFIEQFWRRRDPELSTSGNKFKEEHYRRIAFTNEKFHYAGIPGWSTDRGRVYIIFGEPQSRERYSGGSLYFRPLTEGGGRTRTYPYERWYYDRLPGIGQAVELEFVDKTQTGDFRLALRPEEKDALLMMPGGGTTFFEQIGAETRAGRVQTMDMMRTAGFEGEGFHRTANPFLMLETYFQVQRPPEIKFDDLRAKVLTNVNYDQLAFQVSNSHQLLNEKTFVVPVTVVIPGQELTYEDLPDGSSRAEAKLYASVTSVGGRMIHEFEESIYRDLHAGKGRVAQDIYFQKKLPVPPGVYKLNVIVRDEKSGKMGVIQRRLNLPMKISPDLNLSSLTLADYIVPAQEAALPDPFVTPLGWKVYPSLDGEFQRGDPLGAYFEVYGYAVDSSDLSPDLAITAEVKGRGGASLLDSPSQNQIVPLSDRVLVAKVFDLKSLKPGRYRLEIKVEDRIKGTEVAHQTPFKVTAPAEE